jgi:hypothetical protein
LSLLLLGVCACGGEEDRGTLHDPGAGAGRIGVNVPQGTGGSSTSGGGSSLGDAGEGAGEPDPAAPVVRVTSPEAAESPTAGNVLIAPELDVLCRVTRAVLPGATDVAENSVTLAMFDAEGNEVDLQSAAPTGEPNEFGARFILTKIEANGRVGFRCSATDTSTPAKGASHSIETFVDHGPQIIVGEPEPDSAHALFGAVSFEFEVNAAPVSDDDDAAEVDDVTLEVNGVDIHPGSPENGAYQVFVDFSDQRVFADIPNGSVPVIIRATNQREPEAVERMASYDFVIDGEGPEITIQSPGNEDVVGGQVELRFTVTDELSGVDPDSVVVELNDNENHYGEGGTWSLSGDSYVFLFDSTQAEKDSKIQATITIRATDSVGNISDGESRIVYLDNVPPLVDLDPDYVRESRDGYCSLAFDPVGDLAANDGATVLDVQRFRALVSDRTNEAPGQNIHYYAGTNTSSVYLYVQPNVDEPLLIDTNGDGDCDELIENRNDLPFQHLNGLTPQGNSWFGSEADDTQPLPGGCSYQDQTEPKPLCQPFGSDLLRVVRWDVNERIPVIFAVGNLSSGASCTGTDWEVGQLVTEGWFCAAARAEDNVGNVGISRPLRLCHDGGTGAPVDCGGEPPECTDGCRAPEQVPAMILSL